MKLSVVTCTLDANRQAGLQCTADFHQQKGDYCGPLLFNELLLPEEAETGEERSSIFLGCLKCVWWVGGLIKHPRNVTVRPQGGREDQSMGI